MTDKLIDENGYPPKKCISRGAICKSIQDVEDLHPLRKTVSWSHVAGCCKVICCCAKKKKQFAAELQQCILKEMELQAPEIDTANPYMLLGYGINAYFQILASLARMFFWVTCFAVPIYYTYGVYGHYYSGSGGYPIIRWFAGNFGGSNIFCKQARQSIGKMNIECPIGSVVDTQKTIFGVISNEFPSFTWCNQDAMNPLIEKNSFQNCTASISKPASQTFRKELSRKCRKKQFCSISFQNIVDQASTGKACDGESYLFVQAPCVVPNDQFVIRKIMGLTVACTGVMIYLFVHISIEYIKSVQCNMFVDWDVKTISAADYTVEFRIHESMYEHFQEKYLDPSNPISEIGQFRSYVKDEMEARLTEFPALGIDGPEGDEMPVRIAIITFAFFNFEIIHNLRRRGEYIAAEKWKKLEKINNKMTDRLANSQELLDLMQTPVACFMTLETEEGKCRADEYNDTVKMVDYAQFDTFLGSTIDVQQASEPSDIIWENRHFTSGQKFLRTVVVSFAVFCMLCVSFACIFTAQKTAIAMKQKYPKQNCKEVGEDYVGRRAAWMRDSINEYITNEHIEEKGEVALYTGPMQCFCNAEKKLKHKKAEMYELKNEEGKVTFKHQICLQYALDKRNAKLLALSVTVIIILINTILKKLVVALVSWIGEDTISQQKGSVVKGAFLGQFFNTGFIILIVNANMKQHKPREFWKLFNGPFSDYLPQWYIEVGVKIITTYTVQGIMPFINVVKETVIRKIKGRVDSGCSGDRYKTKSRTIQNYKKAYSGPDMPIHFKYSEALNITFLAMLYGFGMPIMYPMAMAIISNQRLCERIQVAYNYTQPPAMDDSLSNSVMSIMKYAPVMLLFNGYWLMDNQQFFENKWHYKDKVTENMLADHPIYMPPKINQASPLFIMCCTCVFIIVFTTIVPGDLLLQWGFSMSKDSLDVDEDLPNFFEALQLSEAEKIIAENRQMMQQFGFELAEFSLIDKLENSQWPEVSIAGTPWYAILCNNRYVETFAWLGPHVKDRQNYIKEYDNDPETAHLQSDTVSVLLNLGSIPDFVAQRFQLGPTFAENFMGLMDEYKKQFQTDHDNKWDYTNQKLLDKYLAFKRSHESHVREYKEGGEIEMKRMKKM